MDQSAPPTPAQNLERQRKILLVEDDDNLANVYLTRLKAEGFDVKRVPNGEDALASAIEYRPDLILLDVMMPKVSGFDVLDILRNTPETANMKVIMLTALSQESDKQRANSLGVDDYLVKSQVVIADVVERIKHHLGLEQIAGAQVAPGQTHDQPIAPQPAQVSPAPQTPAASQTPPTPAQ